VCDGGQPASSEDFVRKKLEEAEKCLEAGSSKTEPTEAQDPLDVQIGGSHYKDFKIQPVEYTMFNKLNFLQGSVIKRITRYNHTTGKGVQDLEKIKHECDLLIKFFKEEDEN
jgi:hypothetical protein